MDKLKGYIQAILFASETPVKIKEIGAALEKLYDVEIPKEDIQQALDELQAQFNQDTFAFNLNLIAGGYQFLTKSDYYELIKIHKAQKEKRKLTSTALETLSIIAYKQPVTKTDIEKVRGVSSDYAVNKLLEKDLIEIAGRKDAPGKPLIYVTSGTFMEYFGIHGVDDLPQLKDFQQEENTVGEQADIQISETKPADQEETVYPSSELPERNAELETIEADEKIETALETELPPDVSLNEAV